jgi:hypothetical protein
MLNFVGEKMTITCKVGKKVPIPGIDYSSMEFAEEMAKEIPDTASSDVILQAYFEMNTMLLAIIDTQIEMQHGKSSITRESGVAR